MAVFGKKLKIKKNNGTVETITLYTTKTEAGSERLDIKVDGTIVYAAIGQKNDANASSLRISNDKSVLMKKENSIVDGNFVVYDYCFDSGDLITENGNKMLISTVADYYKGLPSNVGRDGIYDLWIDIYAIEGTIKSNKIKLILPEYDFEIILTKGYTVYAYQIGNYGELESPFTHYFGTNTRIDSFTSYEKGLPPDIHSKIFKFNDYAYISNAGTKVKVVITPIE